MPTTAPAPPKKTTAPPRQAPPPSPNNDDQPKARTFKTSSGITRRAYRTVIYGADKVGKSTLASEISKLEIPGLKPKFIDSEDSTVDLDVKRVDGVATWQDLRDALHSPSLWGDEFFPVIDTATAIVPWAIDYVLKNVKHDKGMSMEGKNIEDYGWGKGFGHVAREFLKVLADLDAHYRAGRSSIIICHAEPTEIKNPGGEDYLQWQPRLPNPPKGNARAQICEWCDALLFINFDIAVTNGKAVGAVGGATRTVHVAGQPSYRAGLRGMPGVEDIEYVLGSADIWRTIYKKGD